MSNSTSIVEASIDDLSDALATGRLTSVDLVTKYLLRIATFDARNTRLNSIPLINKDVFDEAAASDDRRSAGKMRGPLDGIPFTVKDSYKVQGMTVASGSVAFQELVANEDAFTVKALRDAGAVLIGKTNMCPMAYGGMLRGLYGRAESPYNLDYLAAAFGSGSSNGSGVSVAASFATFGMGEETVSSGRSPASNNALVAYTPSRGVISIRGNWPLYPTCDVVVPHTRSVQDLCRVLDIITARDDTSCGDFWRDQPFIDISSRSNIWRKGSTPTSDEHYLKGKRIAVPSFYVKQRKDGPYISPAVTSLWTKTRRDFEAAGAYIEIVEDFPVITAYEQPPRMSDDNLSSQPRLPPYWNSVERGELIAHAWEDFLQEIKDPAISSLKDVDPSDIFPQLHRDNPQVKFTEPSNAIQWFELSNHVSDRKSSTRPGKSRMFDIPQLEGVINTLEAMRVTYFEQWMNEHQYDYVIFPAAGDVAHADADINEESAKHAWTNGVKYSHGNRAFRHLGIPSVTVPMGMLQPSQMPMGLTFIGRAYHDLDIINAAFIYEQRTLGRIPPMLTGALNTDAIATRTTSSGVRPVLSIRKCSASPVNSTNEVLVAISGTIHIQQTSDVGQSCFPTVTIFLDGRQVPEQDIELDQDSTKGTSPEEVSFVYQGTTPRPPLLKTRDQVHGKVARDSVMIMVIANNGRGKQTGYIKLIHTSDFE